MRRAARSRAWVGCGTAALRQLLVFWAHGCLSGLSDVERTSVVPDHGPVAPAIDAVAEHAKVDAAIGGDWNGRDDGRRQRRQQQQAEGDEE